MRQGSFAWLKGGFAALVVIAVTFAFASAAAAQGRAHHRTHLASRHHVHHAYRHVHGVRHHGRLSYLPLGSSERGRGYVELAGDPESGLGFYPLPYRYRVGAWRYNMRHRAPPWITNGVLYAEMADRARYGYSYWTTPAHDYRYGVYSPYDGVGTPYFAGYYGPSGDEDDSSFPFGQPYGR
jgi:hypothetical protein